jgi:hypothetical protein
VRCEGRGCCEGLGYTPVCENVGVLWVSKGGLRAHRGGEVQECADVDLYSYC